MTHAKEGERNQGPLSDAIDPPTTTISSPKIRKKSGPEVRSKDSPKDILRSVLEAKGLLGEEWFLEKGKNEETKLAETLYKEITKASEEASIIKLHDALDLVYDTELQTFLIDKYIVEFLSADWRWERIGLVIRAILRAGAYEILHNKELRLGKLIQKYMKIAKILGYPQDTKFVNAVLDKIHSKYRTN